MPRRRRKTEHTWRFFCEEVEVFRSEANEAVRTIITGRRNHVVGAHYSMKMRGHVVHESGVEDGLIRAADCLLRVKRIWAQPETIRMNLFPDFKDEIYTPDFLIEDASGFVRYEVKPWAEIRPPRPAPGDERGLEKWEDAKLLRARLRRIRAAYRRANVAWRVVTDRGIRKRWGSPEVVDEIIANDRWDIEPDDLNRLISGLTDAGGSLPLWRCEALLDETPFPRGVLLSRIPERIVSIDLFAPITSDTIVRTGDPSC
jgi:hypothetical protein